MNVLQLVDKLNSRVYTKMANLFKQSFHCKPIFIKYLNIIPLIIEVKKIDTITGYDNAK